MLKWRKEYGLAAGVIVGLGMVYYVSSSLIPKVMVTLTKAAPATRVSIEKSEFMGSKILCKANGIDKCSVSVFVQDAEGRGIKDRKVAVSGMDTIRPEEVVSGDNGKAEFEVTSLKAGQYELSAMIEGIEMDKRIKVTFR